MKISARTDRDPHRHGGYGLRDDEKGLVDIGMFLEPVDTEGLDYIRIPENDHWVVGMRPDDPLAGKEFITKQDLLGKPLILPERTGVQSEIAKLVRKRLR